MSSNSSVSSTMTISDCQMKPQFWDDDMKMDAWFAPFRNRDLNPLNYDNKMLFWKNNVEMYCNVNKKCYFTLNLLKKFFVRNGKSPSCLRIVLEDMLKEGTIENLSDYENSMTSNTWVGWAVDKLVSSPLKWSFKKVIDVVSPAPIEIDENTEYIHFPMLKKQAENLYKAMNEQARDAIFTYDDVKELYSKKLGTNIDLKTIKLLIHWLQMDEKACVYFENKHCHTHLVKFKTDSHTAPRISETEISIYILQRKEQSLISKLKNMETEKENLQAEVKSFLQQKLRNMAKNTLRKQKELEKRITKLINVLENIQNLLYKVQDTEADSQILESYKVGADALKSRMSKAGLNLDNVDHTMDEIEKALDMHNDIQETLGQAIGVQNEAELESELSELLLNDIPPVPPEPPSPGRKSKDETNIDLQDLPEIPETSLNPTVRVELKRVQT